MAGLLDLRESKFWIQEGIFCGFISLTVCSGRWAMVFDKDGKVIYADSEKGPGEVTVSFARVDGILGCFC
jgi:peroxiredoxin